MMRHTEMITLSEYEALPEERRVEVFDEIVSPGNPTDDYIRKLYYYQKSGVREYWIVDPLREVVLVNYFEGGILSEQHGFDATVKVNIYDDLFIDFAEIAELL